VEYFSTGDVELAPSEVRGLGSDLFQHYFVKKHISMAMDRHDKEKEMSSVLLSAMSADLLSSHMMSEGFMMVLELTEDLTVDIPDDVDILADFTNCSIYSIGTMQDGNFHCCKFILNFNFSFSC
jgi:hypothetical protein